MHNTFFRFIDHDNLWFSFKSQIFSSQKFKFSFFFEIFQSPEFIRNVRFTDARKIANTIVGTCKYITDDRCYFFDRMEDARSSSIVNLCDVDFVLTRIVSRSGQIESWM